MWVHRLNFLRLLFVLHGVPGQYSCSNELESLWFRHFKAKHVLARRLFHFELCTLSRSYVFGRSPLINRPWFETPARLRCVFASDLAVITSSSIFVGEQRRDFD